jgi:pimeloyl-ACP methyl ester carboxylesterase
MLALVVVALVASGGSAGLGLAPRLIDAHACPQLSGFTCSTLLVPLDHEGARSGVLGLRVAAADNVEAPRGVVLFLTGGPGQPGVPYLAKIATALSGVRSDYRIVVYDQRGTGAGALECPALQQAMGSSDLLSAACRRRARVCARAGRSSTPLRHR